MSERTYKLLDGKELILNDNGELWMRHPELGIATMRVESVLGDLLALVDSLQQQVAQLQEMSKLHTSGAKQLVQDLHTLRLDRDELRKALEASWDAIVDTLSVADMEKRDMTLEPWASLSTQRDRISKALGRE